ncbi:hypothetical protein GCM10029964_086250 [Kibdelosporangium lantanae]
MHRTDPEIHVELAGDVPADVKPYAQAKITDVLRFAHRRVLSAKLRLARPHRHRDVAAHVTLDVNGVPINLTAVGSTAREAVDLLQAKVHTRLDRM